MLPNFLDGGENGEMVANARGCFDKAKEMNSRYRLDDRFISPRIIALFANPK